MGLLGVRIRSKIGSSLDPWPEIQKTRLLEFPGSLVVEYLVWSLLWLGSLLWPRFDPLPGNLCIPRVWPKKRKKKRLLHIIFVFYLIYDDTEFWRSKG